MPSRIGALIGITSRDLEKVLYYEEYIVIDPGDTTLKKLDLLSEERYREFRDKFGQKFTAKMGAEAVKELLKEIELDKMASRLKREMKDTKSDNTQKKSAKLLRIVESFKASGNKP